MRPLCVLAPAGLLGALACASPPPTLSATHAAAIRDSALVFLEQFRQASAEARWEDLAALYDEDAGFRFVEDGEVRYRSAAAIREALSTVPPGMRIETSNPGTEVLPLAPGLASVTTLFETRFVDSARTAFEFAGALTLVLRNGPGGWRIVSGHSSTPRPRP